jgi:4-amino-4-deoxy-L-arabinose transferase-like glycosyltransferase
VTATRVAARTALCLILLVAVGLRLHNIGFGLPSMYDPDEPIFMITALRMLAEGTLNPGWFGHPGSTTIYLVALIDVGIASFGLLSGNYVDIDAFSHAAYANPALLFVPARVAMALLGTLCVGLTYALGKRLHGTAAGLVAAAFLAVNALHIAWSQVIRTDIHASVFMLASLLFAARIAERGRLRDYLWAGAFAGFATATKWPAATVFVAVVGGFIFARLNDRGAERPPLWWLPAAGAASLAAIFIASPFIFLDWQTVLANVTGEVKDGHLGHTGGSFIQNLAYYLGQPVGGSIGMIGLILMSAGFILSAVRSPIARWTMIPAAVLFLGLICTQSMIWTRWILPVMPMICIALGVAVVWLGRMIARRLRGWPARLAIGLVVAVAAAPSLVAAADHKAERANDTRIQAARWARANIPAGSRVVFEHLELSLRDQPWQILFPIGDAGCIDGKRALSEGVNYDEVQALRNDSPIIDLGNVSTRRIDTCRADYAILAYYDLYLAERDRYPSELATYRTLLAGGRTVGLYRPEPGQAGGPVVRIVALPPH